MRYVVNRCVIVSFQVVGDIDHHIKCDLDIIEHLQLYLVKTYHGSKKI